MAQADPNYFDPNDPNAVQPVQQPAAKPRWSHHLENDPFGGDVGAWAKQYYDNPNIDPNQALKQQAEGFRNQFGSDAPEDDRSVFEMIATGRTPQPKQSAQPQSVAQQWNTQAAGQVQAGVNTAAPQNAARNSELYNLLLERAKQSTQVDRNDPNIRQQADANSANETRAMRNSLADLAEREGPNANLRGEERLAAERLGQRTGTFEAELVGRELTARRQEIAQALASMQGMLSADEQMQLQRELALLDNAIRERGLGLQEQSLDQDWRRALMQNDQFMGSLGLQAEDRAAYYDLVRRGLI